MKRKTKECQRCQATRKEFGGKLVEMAVEVEKRDLMLDVLAHTIERAEMIIKVRRLMGISDAKRIYQLQDEAASLVSDLQLVMAGSARDILGRVYIPGEQLAECLRRYTSQNTSAISQGTLPQEQDLPSATQLPLRSGLV